MINVTLSEEQTEFIRNHCKVILDCCESCDYPEEKERNERLAKKAQGILDALNKGVKNA